jgi:hypothetical protein
MSTNLECHLLGQPVNIQNAQGLSKKTDVEVDGDGGAKLTEKQPEAKSPRETPVRCADSKPCIQDNSTLTTSTPTTPITITVTFKHSAPTATGSKRSENEIILDTLTETEWEERRKDWLVRPEPTESRTGWMFRNRDEVERHWKKEQKQRRKQEPRQPKLRSTSRKNVDADSINVHDIYIRNAKMVKEAQERLQAALLYYDHVYSDFKMQHGKMPTFK